MNKPASDSSTSTPAPRGLAQALGFSIRRSDLTALPIVLALGGIWLVFQAANPSFLTPQNLTNLLLQITALGIVAIGVVIVLLAGEIDLSVGWVSGLSAAVMAVANVRSGLPGPAAVALGLIVGLGIGVFQGAWVVRMRVPSFVVTLAGLLAWQGALQTVLGPTGTVNLRDEFILALAGTFFPPAIGWTGALAAIVGYAAVLWANRRRRTAAGLSVGPTATAVAQVAGVSALVFGAVAILNADRGVPSSAALLFGALIAFDALTRNTPWGRHVFAIGGNSTAARRSGINVDRARLIVFALASLLAAWGGVLAASRLFAVNQSSGGGDFLVNAIGAAVIGGTSLFGGRGRVWSALLGALVVGSISNGIDLLALPSSAKLVVTGAVLLAAVTVDAGSRARRAAAGG